MKKRLILIVLVLAAVLTQGLNAGASGPVQVQKTTDLAADAELARARNLPLLIMFSLEHCPFCTVVREEFLEPMLISGEYEDKVIIRILEMDYNYVRDFDGKTKSADVLALRYGATLAPTVVLLDAEGRMLAPRLRGITTVDFYGGYLDEAIDAALKRLGKSGLTDL